MAAIFRDPFVIKLGGPYDESAIIFFDHGLTKLASDASLRVD